MAAIVLPLTLSRSSSFEFEKPCSLDDHSDACTLRYSSAEDDVDNDNDSVGRPQDTANSTATIAMTTATATATATNAHDASAAVLATPLPGAVDTTDKLKFDLSATLMGLANSGPNELLRNCSRISTTTADGDDEREAVDSELDSSDSDSDSDSDYDSDTDSEAVAGSGSGSVAYHHVQDGQDAENPEPTFPVTIPAMPIALGGLGPLCRSSPPPSHSTYHVASDINGTAAKEQLSQHSELDDFAFAVAPSSCATASSSLMSASAPAPASASIHAMAPVTGAVNVVSGVCAPTTSAARRPPSHLGGPCLPRMNSGCASSTPLTSASVQPISVVAPQPISAAALPYASEEHAFALHELENMSPSSFPEEWGQGTPLPVTPAAGATTPRDMANLKSPGVPAHAQTAPMHAPFRRSGAGGKSVRAPPPKRKRDEEKEEENEEEIEANNGNVADRLEWYGRESSENELCSAAGSTTDRSPTTSVGTSDTTNDRSKAPAYSWATQTAEEPKGRVSWRGVSWVAKRRQWQAQVTVSDKVHLGNFPDPELAAYAASVGKTWLRQSGFTVKLLDNDVEPSPAPSVCAEVQDQVRRVQTNFAEKWRSKLSSLAPAGASIASGGSSKRQRVGSVSTGGSAASYAPVATRNLAVVNALPASEESEAATSQLLATVTTAADRVVVVRNEAGNWTAQKCWGQSAEGSTKTVVDVAKLKGILQASDIVVPVLKAGSPQLQALMDSLLSSSA